ncbi:ABC transporter substrate-binding protein [Xylanimonas sp. McL0601]|uniref:ABC transporter substrate-binding protein n=1 Tax=Xylanimonas sp. McL0601 TaxID=3414739 RepID=UPI003CF24C71
MHRFTHRPVIRLGAAVTAGALLLAACSGGGGGGGVASPTPAAQVSKAEIDKAMSTPTKLTFWTWVPDIQKEVDLFMKQYPAVQVEVVNVGQGAPHYQKLRTALKSGEGAPDVAQVEFQYLSSFRLGDNLMDLAPYGVSDLKSQYPDWVWKQISDGPAVYGIPQDVGPLGNLYRDDLLKGAGVQPPTTWDEFATAARAYRKAKPDSYLTDLPGNDPGQFTAFLWQSGARPFAFDGAKTVTIDLDTPEVKRVFDVWNTLIQDDLVAVDPDFTDQWYQGLANGKYASWQTAAWGPVFLQGTAAKTSGLWRATTIPQWKAGENVSSNWGGSTDAVLSTTKNKIAAAELAKWINTADEPALKLATEQFLFPAYKPVLTNPTFIDQKSEFYGGQQVNKVFADISQTVKTDFGWLPFMDYVYSSFGETVGKAIADKTQLEPARQAWEKDITDYAKKQGFTVK